MGKSRRDYFLITLILFCVAFCIYLAFSRETFYVITGDTAGYQISSLGELSTIHRAPGLQIISLFFYRICNSDWHYADIAIVCFQHLLIIVGIAFLYKAIYVYTGQHIPSFIISLIASIILLLFGFSHALLTEIYAIATICCQIWCIVKTIREEKTKYTIAALVLGILCTLIRPSHLLTVGIISGFIIVYGLWNHKWILKKGLLAIGGCIIIVFGLCGINKACYGYFGLSDVKPFNDMATLLYADTTESSEYPDITDYVKTISEAEGSNWSKAKDVFSKYGFDDTNRYIFSCKKQNVEQYIRYNMNDLLACSENSMVFDYLRSYGRIGETVKLIRTYIFPFTFGTIWIITGICMTIIIAISIVKKRMLWIEIGICTLIILIGFSSRIACHTDSLVRTGVHTLPCVFFMCAIYWKGLNSIIKVGMQKRIDAAFSNKCDSNIEGYS